MADQPIWQRCAEARPAKDAQSTASTTGKKAEGAVQAGKKAAQDLGDKAKKAAQK
jgi:hypothetical protein